MFVGRQRELNKLESMYSSAQFELAVFYGRRRVGKTTLINEFCRDKETIFFVASEATGESKAIFQSRFPNRQSECPISIILKL